MTLDRSLSAALGRACAMQDEEYVPKVVAEVLLLTLSCFSSFDVDYCVECDDEYWSMSDGNVQFEQPPDKPSKIAAFNCCVRLNQPIICNADYCEYSSPCTTYTTPRDFYVPSTPSTKQGLMPSAWIRTGSSASSQSSIQP